MEQQKRQTQERIHTVNANVSKVRAESTERSGEIRHASKRITKFSIALKTPSKADNAMIVSRALKSIAMRLCVADAPRLRTEKVDDQT